ncbi:MAG: hypothetical protein NXY59_07280 [Aigarchaeota archaeon]|nr:hypothetical protein [Candidatus Pelearchaeum maunauluense]
MEHEELIRKRFNELRERVEKKVEELKEELEKAAQTSIRTK